MKKLLCLLLCAVMLFSVVACKDSETPPIDSSSSESSSSSSSSSSSTPGYTEPEDTYTAWDTEGLHIYVSPNGNDIYDGFTKGTAVETLARANAIAEEYLLTAGSDSEDVIIALEGGRHYIGETVEPVSGTDDVHVYYTSYGDTKAELVGGSKISADKITLCTDPAILNRIDSAEVRANLYEIDLYEYADLLLSIQAKPIKGDHLPSGTSYIPYNGTQFYTDSMSLTAARWPKEGEKFENNIGMDITGYGLTQYINYTKDGQFKTPDEINVEGGAYDLPMNIFVPDNVYEKLKSWDVANSEIYSVDFFSNNWDDNIHRVTGFVDYYTENGAYMYPHPASNTFRVKGYFTTDFGRTFNHDMAPDDGAGNAPYRRYFFMNVLEEILLNGEY